MTTITGDYLRTVPLEEVRYRPGYQKIIIQELLQSFMSSIALVDSRVEILDVNEYPFSPDQIRQARGDLVEVSFQPAFDKEEVDNLIESTARTLELWVADCVRRAEEERARLEAERIERELQVRLEQEAREQAEREAREAEEARQREEEAAARRAEIEARRAEIEAEDAVRAEYVKSIDYTGVRVNSQKSLIELIASLEWLVKEVGDYGAQFSVVSFIQGDGSDGNVGGYFGVQNVSIDEEMNQIILDSQGRDATESLKVGELLEALLKIQSLSKRYGIYKVAIWGGRFGAFGVDHFHSMPREGVAVINTVSN